MLRLCVKFRAAVQNMGGVQHLAHRRDSLRCDLYQIEPCVLSSTHGHLNADHTFLLAVCSDQANLTVTDLTVENQTAKFLAAGHKVKVSIRFRGREMAHSALGADVLKRFAEGLPQASMDKAPVLEGRTMSILLIPKPNKD